MSDPDIERPQSDIDAESWAKQFHDEYERLAAQFHYTTRADTRAFDPASPNGQLMIAVCKVVITRAAELAVAKERERCAKIAETHQTRNNVTYGFQSGFVTAVGMIAAAIRAGKEVGSE